MKYSRNKINQSGKVLLAGPEMGFPYTDANLVVDHKTGEQYMVYGSFWGGIRIIKLDSTTGLTAEDGFGIPLATRPREMVDTAEDKKDNIIKAHQLYQKAYELNKILENNSLSKLVIQKMNELDILCKAHGITL